MRAPSRPGWRPSRRGSSRSRDKAADYAQKVLDTLFATPVVNGTAGLRVDIDTSNERMQKKIRDAQLQKIPYMLVVGEREAAEGKVAVRLRSGQGSGRHAAGNFHRPHQKRGGIPAGCGRIALAEAASAPYSTAQSGACRRERHPAHPSKGPRLRHDRTSFRWGRNGTREVRMRAAVKRREVIVPRRFQAAPPRRPRMARASTTKSSPAPSF